MKTNNQIQQHFSRISKKHKKLTHYLESFYNYNNELSVAKQTTPLFQE
jgi:hypothetical protein